MSWKSKLKTAGWWAVKTLVPIVGGWIVEKHVKNQTAKDLLNAVVKQAPIKPSLQKSIDKYIREQPAGFDEEMAKLPGELGAILRRNALAAQQVSETRITRGRK